MQKGQNVAILRGFVGKDPVLRSLPSGSNTTTVDLGTTRIWRDRASGEQKSHTEWHRIVCWNSTADWVVEKIRTGMVVAVEGEIRYRPYTVGNVEKYATEIFAKDITVVNWESKADRDSRGPNVPRPAGPIGQNTAAHQTNDDIPF